MASRKKKTAQEKEDTPTSPEASAAPVDPPAPEEDPSPAPPAPPKEEPITEEQMLRIKRASAAELEGLLVPGFPETLAKAVRQELEMRRANAKPKPARESLHVTKGGTLRTRDGFFTEVKVGSFYPISDKPQLDAAGIETELVKSTVVEDEMGVPRTRLA